MLFLKTLANPLDLKFTLSHDALIATLLDAPQSSDNIIKIHAKTLEVLQFLQGCLDTLPSNEHPHELESKKNFLIYMQKRVAEIYCRQFPFESLSKINILLGKTNWISHGKQVDVYIFGTWALRHLGRGLNITLINKDSVFAEATFYEKSDCLHVIDVKSHMPPDPITNQFEFIALLFHIIFNLWEKQECPRMNVHLKRAFVQSSKLGFDLEKAPYSEYYFLDYQREECSPSFSYFKKLIPLNFPLVRKA